MLMNLEWLDFIRQYEVKDPEPDLGDLEPCTYSKRFMYETECAQAHMDWHRRLTDAWMTR
jgi:hypothetical protein